MFSLIVLKFPGVAGMGTGGPLKGSLGRGLLPKGLQTFILFKQKTILFTSLFKIRKLYSFHDPDPFPQTGIKGLD